MTAAMSTGITQRPLAERFAHDLIGNLPPALFGLLEQLVENDGQVAAHPLDRSRLTELQARLPFLLAIDPDGTVGLTDPAARDLLSSAIAWRAASDSLRAASIVSMIGEYLANDDYAAALLLFQQEGGAVFAHHHGLLAAQSALALFPAELRAEHDSLVLAEAINAMKSGFCSHADHLIEQHFGAGSGQLRTLVLRRQHIGPEFAIVCFIRAVYAEHQIDDAELALLFDVLGRLPPDADLQRGLLHNVALDVFVRRRAWGMAEETALQALYHFRRLPAPLSAFYIGLYRAVIHLALGELGKADDALNECAIDLDKLANVSFNDRQLLHALRLVCQYEAGKHEPLVQWTLSNADAGLFAEIWPSVAEPIIAYGSLALATHIGLSSARNYLARWRVQELCSERTARFIIAREIRLLQAHHRWHEAADMLDELKTANRPSPHAHLGYNEQIEIDLAGLSDQVERLPADPMVLAALTDMLARPQLTRRQKVEVQLLVAKCALTQRQLAAFRSALLEMMDAINNLGLAALFFENRQVLQQLLAEKRARGLIGAFGSITGYTEQTEPTSNTDFTAQELRILLLIAENTPNKIIAARIGISVPTVRFHLKNIYRKLGCNDRRTATLASIARGLIAA